MDAEAANNLVNSLLDRLANSSNHDDLRAEMLCEGIAGHNVNAAFVVHGLNNRSSIIWNDVIDHPFFVIQGLGSGGQLLNQWQSLHISHDISAQHWQIS